MPDRYGRPTTKERGLGWDYERIARVIRRAAVGSGCPKCGVVMGTGRSNPAAATVDHKLPRVLGGTNDPENLWAVCRRCNCRSGQVLGMRSPKRLWRAPAGVFGPLSR